MHSPHIASNPFALLMDPEAVLAAVNGSDRLGRLHSRIWRPLDKPLVPHTDNDAHEAGVQATGSDEADH